MDIVMTILQQHSVDELRTRWRNGQFRVFANDYIERGQVERNRNLNWNWVGPLVIQIFNSIECKLQRKATIAQCIYMQKLKYPPSSYPQPHRKWTELKNWNVEKCQKSKHVKSTRHGNRLFFALSYTLIPADIPYIFHKQNAKM